MTVSLNLQSLNLQDYFEVIKPGFVRLKGHRIGIEHIVRSYQEGYTPEQMTQEFPGVGLEKIMRHSLIICTTRQPSTTIWLNS
ncbi:conserved hypothetical protein [Beggiatoa sp. PS]|nr:conserved hypothetical protein [Beggiatoa sp. PS]